MNQTEWSRDYVERAYDRLAITIPKGRREQVKAAAAKQGKTVNGLVNEFLRTVCGIPESEWKTPVEKKR